MRKQGERDAGRDRKSKGNKINPKLGIRILQMKLLVIDNYDSFTYNLVQYFGELGAEIVVKRNDELSVQDVKQSGTDRICISPGPGRPENAGVSETIIREFANKLPILGVCLGHQCIAQVFGGKVSRAP